jgi:hypothetical protein
VTFICVLYNLRTQTSRSTFYATSTHYSIHIERRRRRALCANAGIIGDDVIAALTTHAYDEEKAENVYLSALHVFRETLEDFVRSHGDAHADLAEKKREYAANIGAQYTLMLDAAERKFGKHADNICAELAIVLRHLLETLPPKGDVLVKCRHTSKADSDAATDLLEMERLRVMENVQTGLFRGLNADLAAALRFFLGQVGVITLALVNHYVSMLFNSHSLFYSFFHLSFFCLLSFFRRPRSCSRTVTCVT